MKVNFADPTHWSPTAADALCVGLDIGGQQDHAALVVGGAWRSGAKSVLGIFHTQQIALGTPLDDVCDYAADLARQYHARIVADASNNSAAISLLAARFGKPANALVAGVITQADSHAMQPQDMLVSLGGQRSHVPRWTLSKRELIESVSAEIDNGTLKISKTGDYEALRDELGTLERTVRQSGSVAYSAPAGKHDDLVMALTLCVFGLRRIGSPTRVRRHARKPAPSAAAWT